MADLEDTVLSLRRVLNEKEREVSEYEAKTRSLESELGRARSRDSQPGVPRLESREEVSPGHIYVSSQLCRHLCFMYSNNVFAHVHVACETNR